MSFFNIYLSMTPQISVKNLIFADPIGLLQIIGAGVIFVGVYLTTHG